MAIYDNAALRAESAPGDRVLPYVLVNTDQNILGLLGRFGDPDAIPTGPLTAARAASGEVRPGVGDVLGITIFENGPGGLFTGEEAKGGASSFELPPQTIDGRGDITIPYAGRIRAAGRTLSQIQSAIEAAIKEKSIQPQVVVTLREQKASQVSVLGQVNAPGVIPLSAGMRVLDAIARAGGVRGLDQNAEVVLRRHGRTMTFSYETLLRGASSDAFVQAGDIISITTVSRTFVVFGATGRNSTYDIDAPVVTLMDGLGKAQGLIDRQSDPGALFVYRFEDRRVLENAGYPVEAFPGKWIPTIYTVSLDSPTGFFLASSFKIRNRDVVYIANAGSVQLTKFLELLRAGTGPAVDIATINSLSSGTAVVAAPVQPIGP